MSATAAGSPDVVVIGSGAGGAAAAWALADAGVDVLVLESGPRFNPAADYGLHREDWELNGFPQPPGSVGGVAFGAMQPLAPEDGGLRSWSRLHGRLGDGRTRVVGDFAHVRGVGGSTLHFSGEAHRLHPRAMRLRSDFGVGADWPIDYATLEPFYTEAEQLIGVAGAAHPSRPRQAPYPLPPHPPSWASRQVAAGCGKLGLGWTPNPLAILSRPYDGRPPCNYCGNCTRGCPRGDKGSADVTWMRKALASGHCRLETGRTVLELVAGDADRIAQLTYVDATGVVHRLRPRIIVLACGVVETPRLLLNSACAAAPQGLGNESGQVGRNFLETVSWTSSGLHSEPLGSHRGVPSDAICWDFNAPDAVPGTVGGCRFTLGMAEAALIGPVNYARRVVGGWGREHKRAMREHFGRVLTIGSIGECLPNPGSFVDLDPARRDAHDLPVARINSRLGEDALTRLAFMRDQCRQILTASGAGDIFEESGTYDYFNSSHVFGTCRMGVDPETSVVDPWCRSHRWRNLYIADASVFPSSGGGESPSLTISALAVRSARRIAAELLPRSA